jgi:hypothetical protein
MHHCDAICDRLQLLQHGYTVHSGLCACGGDGASGCMCGSCIALAQSGALVSAAGGGGGASSDGGSADGIDGDGSGDAGGALLQPPLHARDGADDGVLD